MGPLGALLAFVLALPASAQTAIEIPSCRGNGNRFTGDGLRLPPSRAYSELGFAGIDKKSLAGLLQDFVSARHGKSYRRLGDYKDFFHGHLLYAQNDATPIAILYHTQEAAAAEHETNPGGPYDYIDAQGRNWLQTLRTGELVNAVKRVRRTYPDAPDWAAFRKNCVPRYLKAWSVDALMLDLAESPGLSGVIQFNFLAIDCAAAPTDEALNGVRLELPGGGRACLLLGTNSMY